MPVAGKNGVRIGIAGWAMPATLSDKSPEAQSHLEQYSRYFNAVEINSSFYRPHRRHTYQRWGASVPPSFRFAVKMPKLITHERRLSRCAAELGEFLHGAAGLGEKLGVLLVQLPASVVFDEPVTRDFLELLTAQTTAKIVCEPRSASWFVSAAEDLFTRFGVTRVSAHPVPWHVRAKRCERATLRTYACTARRAFIIPLIRRNSSGASVLKLQATATEKPGAFLTTPRRAPRGPTPDRCSRASRTLCEPRHFLAFFFFFSFLSADISCCFFKTSL